MRVSGPQVGANKRDAGDRPCMYVFPGDDWFIEDEHGPLENGGELVKGVEHMGHEVRFTGPTTLVQEFDEGCPTTGAILWLETTEPLYLIVRENHDLHPHVKAKMGGLLDDVERRET